MGSIILTIAIGLFAVMTISIGVLAVQTWIEERNNPLNPKGENNES